METPTSPSAKTPTVAEIAQKLRHLPAEARSAYERFRAGGDVSVLDPLILGILEAHLPRPYGKPLAECPGTILLIDDLGFDSLAITEIVFFAEDLFGISIANEEIMQVRTLDDLRSFIRGKVAARGSV